jgi:peptidoglycan/LPS O-acetylase OafA/YrhL
MKKELSIYIDVLRIVAAFFVFFGHAHFFTGCFTMLRGNAREAVAVFFVLSGFVISHVTDGGKEDARQYAMARMVRIYSVAAPAIFFTFLFDYIGMARNAALYGNATYFNANSGIFDVFRALTFTNEIWNEHVIIGTNEPYWSLGFEVCYYAIFGLFWYLRWRWWAKATLIVALLLVVGPKIASYFPLWLLGVCTHKVVIERAKAGVQRRCSIKSWMMFITPLVGYFFLKLALYISKFELKPMFDRFEFSTTQFFTIGYFFLVGILVSTHLIAFPAIAEFRFLSHILRKTEKFVRWVAGATFTLYLLHLPILIAMASILPGNHGEKTWACGVVVGTLILVGLLAEISERRKQWWRRVISQLFRWVERRYASI